MTAAVENKKYQADVAVIGLGPVGALLAALLVRQGLRVVALDREPDIMQVPRGVGIDGEIMRVVQSLGLATEMQQQLRVFGGAQYLDSAGEVVATRPPSAVQGAQGWPDRYNVHQPEFESVLRDSLRNNELCTELVQHEVTALANTATGVVVDAVDLVSGNPVQVTARFAVGADGGRSITRRMISSSYEDFGLNEPWIVADFAIEDSADLPLINTHFADPVSPAIYIRVVRNIRRFEFRARPDEDLEAAVLPENIWERVSRWLAPGDAELIRSAVYTHRSLVVDTWREGNILLAGDAAHQTPPFLGQGLCTGVRDAAALAWRLNAVISRGVSDQLLDSYGTERGAHAKHFIATATKLGSKLSNPSKAAIDELNSQIGREGRGTKPRLGTGLFEVDLDGGYLAPQPCNAAEVRLDDLVGHEFAVVLSAATLLQLPLSARTQLERVHAQCVVADGALRDWLQNEEAVAIIVRPDRYIYGVYATVEQLVQACADLSEVLSA